MKHYGNEWTTAACWATWNSTFNDFAKTAFELAQSQCPVQSKPPRSVEADQPARKKRRVAFHVEVPWRPLSSEFTAAEVVGDSQLVLNWMNGYAAVDSHAYVERVATLVNEVAQAWSFGTIVPRIASSDWWRHIYRELNTKADALANRAMDRRESTASACLMMPSKPKRLCAWFDGGVRDSSLSSCGWLLEASWSEPSEASSWTVVAYASLLLPSGTTTVDAELTGCEQATAAMLMYAKYGLVHFDPDLCVERV